MISLGLQIRILSRRTATVQCRLTDFHSKTQSSNYEDVGRGHTTHGLPAIHCKLPAVQIFINIHGIRSFVRSIGCMTILHLKLFCLGKVLRW